MAAYPRGTKFNRWLLNKEKQRKVERYSIRRWIHLPDGTSKLERLPVQKYKLIRDNLDELNKLIVRLNAQIPPEQKTRQAVEIKHAFISPQLLDDYKDYLMVQIPTRPKAVNEYNFLLKYFLHFFIGRLNMADPLQWHAVHKTEWARFLVSKDAPPSAGSKKEIIQGANRFITWLHDRRPTEVPPLKFQPLSKARFKEIQATREMNGEARKPQFISDLHWVTIKGKLDDVLGPFVFIAYHYGLRRAETMGLAHTDIRHGYLSVARQLAHLKDKAPVFAALKGREVRRVPHWMASQEQVYEWIVKTNANVMHPDTLSDLWCALMANLKLKYTFHDLRHTWITKMLRERNPRDVQLAAGHKNIETTMRYAHDDRVMDDAIFVPRQKAS